MQLDMIDANTKRELQQLSTMAKAELMAFVRNKAAISQGRATLLDNSVKASHEVRHAARVIERNERELIEGLETMLYGEERAQARHDAHLGATAE